MKMESDLNDSGDAASSELEARSEEPGAGSWELGAGSWKLEDTEQISDAS
jgi:hypothetical protein